MITFIFQSFTESALQKEELIEIINERTDYDFKYVTDITDNKLDFANEILLGKVVSSKYGKHPHKGNYKKVLLCHPDNPNNNEATAFYFYKRTVPNCNLSRNDFVAFKNFKLTKIPEPNTDVETYEIFFNDERLRLDNPFIWILTKSIPVRPFIYTQLKNVGPKERHIVFGVVMDKEPIVETRGTSNICCLKLRDKSQDNDFSLNIFLKEKSDLPEINYGDIILCHLKGGTLNSRTCGTVFAPMLCSFWSCNLSGPIIPKAKRNNVIISDVEKQKVIELREWVAERFFHLLFATPGIDMKPVELNLKMISQLDVGEYFDFMCQIVEVIKFNRKCVVLRVWDGTKRSTKSFVDADIDYSNDCQLIMNYIVDIFVYGDYSAVAENLMPGDTVLIRDINCAWEKNCMANVNDKMKLQLQGENKHGRRTIIKCDSGQSIYLRRRLNELKTNHASIDTSCKMLDFDASHMDHVMTDVATENLNFDINEPANLVPDTLFNCSMEMNTQDLSLDILNDVMERRAEEDCLVSQIEIDENNDFMAEMPSVAPAPSNVQTDVVTTGSTEGEQQLDMADDDDDEYVFPPINKRREGRWFIIPVKVKDIPDENKKNEEIVLECAIAPKRNVIAEIDLTDSDHEELPRVAPHLLGSLPRSLTFDLGTGTTTLPLATLREVAASKLERKHRVRVKAIGMEPQITEAFSILRFICPTCKYMIPFEIKNVPCQMCAQRNPQFQSSLMQPMYYMTFVVKDRTGEIPVTLSGHYAEQFLCTTTELYISSETHRQHVKGILSYIYYDYNYCQDVLACTNPWMDLIIETISATNDFTYFTHYIADTKALFAFKCSEIIK